VKANVRIIAATNHNLQHLMQQGLFREDLFYRLNVVPLRLPPLRERTEDIGPLVNHFLKQASAGGLPAKRFTPDAVRALAGWSWPGNVRELENLVRRLQVLVGEDTISAEMVESELAAVRPVEAAPIEVESLSASVDQHIRRYFGALDGAVPPSGLHARILREVEHPLIVATLEITRGNQVKAAEILGINRNTLRKRIRELGIWSGR
jgi:two-component system nitrogen regulation response regulator GlnG